MSVTIPIQAPNGLDEIIAHYGDPHIQMVNGQWTVDSKWEAANMTTIRHPLIPAAQGGKLYIHTLAAQPFLNVLERWSARIAAGDPYRIIHLGCFAPRAQRGSSSLIPSTHSWGIAVDVNPDTNALIAPCAPDDPRRQTAKDLPDAWIADWEAEGWMWGGRFSRRYDPMHGQLCTGF